MCGRIRGMGKLSTLNLSKVSHLTEEKDESRGSGS